AIYATLALAGIVAALSGKPWLAGLSIGAALAFKLQAAFVIPWLMVFTIRGRYPLWGWLLLPVPYAVASIWPVIEGRSLHDLATIYVNQGEHYRQLTLDAPTMYAWFNVRQGFGEPGLVIAAAAVLGVV